MPATQAWQPATRFAFPSLAICYQLLPIHNWCPPGCARLWPASSAPPSRALTVPFSLPVNAPHSAAPSRRPETCFSPRRVGTPLHASPVRRSGTRTSHCVPPGSRFCRASVFRLFPFTQSSRAAKDHRKSLGRRANQKRAAVADGNLVAQYRAECSFSPWLRERVRFLAPWALDGTIFPTRQALPLRLRNRTPSLRPQ